jgi:hypothetical protein
MTGQWQDVDMGLEMLGNSGEGERRALKQETS